MHHLVFSIRKAAIERPWDYPLTSVATWLSPGVYNASYDIWFNKTDAHPAQDNATEIMIWLAQRTSASSWSAAGWAATFTSTS
jgi:hypothetical protein